MEESSSLAEASAVCLCGAGASSQAGPVAADSVAAVCLCFESLTSHVTLPCKSYRDVLVAIFQELYHASPAIPHVATVVFRGGCRARSSTVETRVLPRWPRSEWAVDQAVGGAQSHNSQHQASQSLQRPLALWFGAYVRQ